MYQQCYKWVIVEYERDFHVLTITTTQRQIIRFFQIFKHFISNIHLLLVYDKLLKG